MGFGLWKRTYSVVGMSLSTYNFPAGADPGHIAHNQNIVYFSSSGYLRCQRYLSYGNAGFKDNQIVRLELDCEKGTLTLFIDNVQQPVYVSGIKEKMRFIVNMHYEDTYCIVHSLKKLATPTLGHTSNEKAVQWLK
ncbi:MAG: hypothetical protein EZS28_016522 [Streblomastix strix]|uniref:SPRY domain-containing protein n=1 Tax=Streblomastix strix TaxID=222440 RepID=A0A5J4W0E6_9EUKA|nr:MAG: hypothetical protein EZS28_016522 [Streblomastix strix]